MSLRHKLFLVPFILLFFSSFLYAAEGGASTVVYPPFIVNLTDPGAKRYLKASVSLELTKNEEFYKEVAMRGPKIKDTIIGILSSKSYDEVATPAGKDSIRKEIARRINSFLMLGKVEEVYLTDFIIQ